MDEYQRRVWTRMIESVDAFRAGDVGLRRLVDDLQGLLNAADLRDTGLIDDWWDHATPIDMELELRTEAWAPPGSASDGNLDRALGDFQAWARSVLDATDHDRS